MLSLPPYLPSVDPAVRDHVRVLGQSLLDRRQAAVDVGSLVELGRLADRLAGRADGARAAGLGATPSCRRFTSARAVQEASATRTGHDGRSVEELATGDAAEIHGVLQCVRRRCQCRQPTVKRVTSGLKEQLKIFLPAAVTSFHIVARTCRDFTHDVGKRAKPLTAELTLQSVMKLFNAHDRRRLGFRRTGPPCSVGRRSDPVPPCCQGSGPSSGRNSTPSAASRSRWVRSRLEELLGTTGLPAPTRPPRRGRRPAGTACSRPDGYPACTPATPGTGCRGPCGARSAGRPPAARSAYACSSGRRPPIAYASVGSSLG